MTFHWRGTNSSISVTSSPSLCRTPPQHGQACVPDKPRARRQECSGNAGAPACGALKGCTVTLGGAAISAASRPGPGLPRALTAAAPAYRAERASPTIDRPLMLQLGDPLLDLLDAQGLVAQLAR